jgi:hypothetical protein
MRAGYARRGRVTGLVAAFVLGVAALATFSATGRENGGGSWRRIAGSPLPARADAIPIWTGKEVLVVGGHDLACGSTACHPTAADMHADAAAYDPARDSWRLIAPLPIRTAGFAAAAVLGDTAYLEATEPDPGYRDRHQPIEDDALHSRASVRHWYAYSLIADRWREIRPPAPNGERPLAVAGRLVDVNHDPSQGPAYVAYDPARDRWTPLPDDGLGTHDITRRGITDGTTLYSVAVPSTALTDRPRAHLAAFDFATRAWTRLPDTPPGVEPTLWAGGRLVDPPTDPINAPVAGYDPATRTWSAHPGWPVKPRNGNRTWIAEGLAGRDDVVVSAGRVLHVPNMSWSVIAPHKALGGTGDPAEVTAYQALIWAGDRLFVWGGITMRPVEDNTCCHPDLSPPGRLRDTGWTWQPALALGVGAVRLNR